MKELIEFIAQKMVEHPEDVQVRLVEGEGDKQNYELQVNPEDMGRIIGKSGRTAKAIRALVSSAAAKANIYANLEIVE
ncbi:MAG: KH domain-containing protein [Candidatus Hydrogenedentes bacterium]|nr:KH domain-containing protein [Candidatus Hydrogenedentota bacterium]